MTHTYKYPKADNTVDIVVFGLDDNLKVLLIERGREGEPFFGHWALPGGFVNMDEDLTDAAYRELREETGIRPSYLEQLYTFGTPGRDPRGRVISTAYLGLVKPEDVQVVAADDARDARWWSVDALPPLAFDHAAILDMAVRRLRGKLRWQPVGVELLPSEFTLTELRKVYEIILARKVDDRNFRHKVLSFGVLQETGGVRKAAHRPATLYRFDPDAYARLRHTGLDFEV